MQEITLAMALLSLLISGWALFRTEQFRSWKKDWEEEKQDWQKKRSLRELDKMWESGDLRKIDTDEPAAQNVVRAVDFLGFIAMEWNDEVAYKDQLKRRYGDIYVELFEDLENCDLIPEGLDKPCSEQLKDEVKKVYEEIKSFEEGQE